jgi:hypothetical protein
MRQTESMIPKSCRLLGRIMRETKGEIVNLRRARKEKARAAAAKEAAANRTKSGRTRAGRDAADQARVLEEKRLEAHRREIGPAASNDGVEK